MNNEKKGFDWGRSAAILICLAFAAAAAYLFFKYLLSILLPFAVGALIAAAVSPLAKKISERSRISHRAATAVLVFLLLVTVFLCVGLTAKRLICELGELAAGIGEDGDPISRFIGDVAAFINGLGEKLSTALRTDAMRRISADSIDAFLSGIVQNTADAISAFLSNTVSSVASSLPKTLFAVAVTVISAFYFALDREKISAAFFSIMPERSRGFLRGMKKEAAQTAGRYLRAFSLLLLIMFLVLFVGLTIIGAEYALLLAAITAIVDILPVLGVGTVLVPWSVISYISGDISRGTAILILYVAVIILRQFIEPKIIGKSLGIHPLLSLFSMYVGLRVFGVIGIILAPALVAGLRTLKDAGLSGDDISQTP